MARSVIKKMIQNLNFENIVLTKSNLKLVAQN